MLQPLHAERLSEGVVNGLLAAIRSGELCPGDRLPAERRLAETFGVSRASVREGLRVLELMEAIEVRQGRGAVVLGSGDRPSGRLLRRWLEVHRRELLELLQVRETLEATAAELAAGRGGPAVEPRRPRGGGIEELVDADLDFHNAVAARSGNLVLGVLVQELNSVLAESRYAMLAIPGRADRSLREHRRIAAAVNGREPEKAAAAMRRHIHGTREEIRGMIAGGET